MPRRPKPFFHRGWWCTNVGGSRTKLAKGRAAAEDALLDLLQELRTSANRKTYPELTVLDLCDQFLDWVEVNLAKATYEDHRRWLKKRCALHGKKRAREIRKLNLEEWKTALAGQYPSNSSINHHIKAVKACWGWAVTHMSDADLGDIIAFLTSDDRVVQSNDIIQPAVQLTRRGRLAARFVFHPSPYPMLPYKELTDEELRAVFAYLHTVPRISNSDRTPPPTPTLPGAAIADRDALLARGAELYAFYSCRSCHGTTGVGMGDLTQANRKYPRDEELKAWIRNPARFKPGTKMPTFDRVIKPDDYAPLVAFVRQLARQAGR